jgi:hypothetical protein
MRGISWIAEDVLSSQEGLCSMELVNTITYCPGIATKLRAGRTVQGSNHGTERHFSPLHNVQKGSGAHLAFYSISNEVHSRG